MGRKGKGKSRLLLLCILKFAVFLSFWHFSFHLLCCQHVDLILTLMNQCCLLSNIIFHLRLPKHFTNVKEALQYQRETKPGLADFTQDAAVSAPHWQMLSSFYSGLNHGIARSSSFYSFPLFSIPEFVWLLNWPPGAGRCFWGAVSSTVWVRSLLLYVLTPAWPRLLKIRAWEWDWSRAHMDRGAQGYSWFLQSRHSCASESKELGP